MEIYTKNEATINYLEQIRKIKNNMFLRECILPREYCASIGVIHEATDLFYMPIEDVDPELLIDSLPDCGIAKPINNKTLFRYKKNGLHNKSLLNLDYYKILDSPDPLYKEAIRVLNTNQNEVDIINATNKLSLICKLLTMEEKNVPAWDQLISFIEPLSTNQEEYTKTDFANICFAHYSATRDPDGFKAEDLINKKFRIGTIINLEPHLSISPEKIEDLLSTELKKTGQFGVTEPEIEKLPLNKREIVESIRKKFLLKVEMENSEALISKRKVL